ncbi:MAG: hypothetical protein ABI777_06540 [Betaproteobacteria bacterium]
MTLFRTFVLRVMLALIVAGFISGCLPIGFRGSSLYTASTVAPAHG